MIAPVAAVIDEIDPKEEGWKCIGEREWQMPDGRLFVFPLGAKQMLKRFRQIRPGDLLK